MSNSDLPPLPSDVEALLAVERHESESEPDEASRDEVLSRVLSTLALPGGPVGAGGGGTAGLGAGAGAGAVPPASAWFGTWVAAGLAVVTVGLAGGGAWFLTRGPASSAAAGESTAVTARASNAPSPTGVAPAPAARALPPPARTPPAPLVSPPASAHSIPAQAPAPEREARDEDLREERAVLDRARAALARHDGGAAMDAVREHQRRFPHGRLGEEREAMAVQALVVGGQYAAARTRGERFHHSYPASMLGRAVDHALASIP